MTEVVVSIAGQTHPGSREGPNEDAIGWDESRALAFIADGMGGHARGDVASQLVRKTLLEESANTSLLACVLKAHESVVQAARDNSAYLSMGSTVVAARVVERQAELAWVGDSRAYLWRASTLQALTRDHSYLEVLRQQQRLSDTQMREHPNKHLVTQTLGLGSPQPSQAQLALHHGDWLVLCSDGLNEELTDAQIAEVLGGHQQPQAASEALVEAALAKGGRDNVSVVVLHYLRPDIPVVQGRRRWSMAGKWPIALGMLTALLTGVLWWWFKAEVGG